MNRQFENIIFIDDFMVDPKICSVKFHCDLKKCKGGCCTMKSDFGAPLVREEIFLIEKNIDLIKKYLPKENILEIEKNGFWEEKNKTLMTKSLNKQDCVFVYYENDIAKCAIEKSYQLGESDFIKPLSCHLFPIRLNYFGGPVLKYEEYFQCSTALEKGRELNITILEFCKDALIRAFGNDFYNKLSKYAE